MAKKFYQTEWQGIQFEEFAKLSLTSLPSSQFYSDFYRIFYERFPSWTDISSKWRYEKRQLSEFILTKVEDKSKVLVVGCGLGLTETFFKQNKPDTDLFIHELTKQKRLLPKKQFWGWMRTKEDYNKIMIDSGFLDINEGFINVNGNGLYFITGKSFS